MSDYSLYINTVRYLRPIQMIGQLTKKKRLGRIPKSQPVKHIAEGGLPLFIEQLDCSRDFLSRFSVSGLLDGDVTLLNRCYDVDFSDWTAEEAPPLWSFNLHYFEYCIALAARYRGTGEDKYYECFRRFVSDWIESCPIGVGDGWHPYTISMRIPNWLICMELFSDELEQDEEFRDDVYQSIYDQYRVLSLRLETWQLGNHYLENLKTLVLCSLLFEDESAYSRWFKKLLRELDEQILTDGVHYERSVMYHKIVLEDMLRVYYALKDRKPNDAERLRPYIVRMTGAMASLEKGMGHTPLFNDSGDNVAKSCESLLTAAAQFDIAPEYTESFEKSGYYKFYEGCAALLFDAGDMGPAYMSGHGHCDCLSFELSLDGVPLFVNCGTYEYQGDMRSFFRSTAAHNTAAPKDCEQAELWGEHRVARRMSDITAIRGENTITGSCTFYDGTDHERKITLRDGEFSVMDNITNTPVLQIHSYLHIAPGCDVIKRGGKYRILYNGIDVCTLTPRGCDVALHTNGELTTYAPEFGRKESTTCLEFLWEKDGQPHGYTCELRTRNNDNA